MKGKEDFYYDFISSLGILVCLKFVLRTRFQDIARVRIHNLCVSSIGNSICISFDSYLFF